MASHHLTVSDLTVSYQRIPALHHLSFEVGCGQCVGLLGPNGAGKSTLLKTLAGLLPRETGAISFHGHAVTGATQDFAYLPQREQIDWDFPTNVRGLVEMGRFLRLGWWRTFGAADRLAVNQAIESMQLTSLELWRKRRMFSCWMNHSPAWINRLRKASGACCANSASKAN